MTVICTDGKSMAGDGLVCAGQLIVAENAIKVFKANGSIIGLCGDAAYGETITKWFQDGERDKDKPTDKQCDFSGLILRPNGKAYWFGDNLSFVEYELPAAIGSGDHIAVGAMEANKSPKEAVKIVSKRSNTVGGKITELFL